MENKGVGLPDNIYELASVYLLQNYDYCYLKGMHRKLEQEGAEVIVTGSSYVMNGIAEKEMDTGCVNFSISSQDLYGEFLNARKAVEESPVKIRQCIINIGYYGLYQDTSISYPYQMKDVFGPLFGDTHHAVVDKLNRMDAIDFDRERYSDQALGEVCEELALALVLDRGTFYGGPLTREKNSLMYKRGLDWRRCTVEERIAYGRERAEEHNEFLRYRRSREENEKILRSYLQFLEANGIVPIMVILPHSRYYLQYLDPRYAEDLHGLLENLPERIDFIDMNETDFFEEEDFLDMDHLNLNGALKATELLNRVLPDIRF